MEEFTLETKRAKFTAKQQPATRTWEVEYEFSNGVKGEFTTPKWADTRLMQHLSNLQKNIVG